MHWRIVLVTMVMTLFMEPALCKPGPKKILKKILMGVKGVKLLQDIGLAGNLTMVPTENKVEKLEPFVSVNKVNTSIKASSGGYSASVRDRGGKFGASGTAKSSVDMKLNKGQGINVKWELPSGKAQAGPVGASINLSGKVEAGLSKDKKDFKAGVEGPKATLKLGPVKLDLDTGFSYNGGDKTRTLEVCTVVMSIVLVLLCTFFDL